MDSSTRVTGCSGLPGLAATATSVRSAPAILSFFVTNLKAAGGIRLHAFPAGACSGQMVTPTGQVGTTFQGETVASLTRTRAACVAAAPATITNGGDVSRLQTRLAGDIRRADRRGARTRHVACSR